MAFQLELVDDGRKRRDRLRAVAARIVQKDDVGRNAFGARRAVIDLIVDGLDDLVDAGLGPVDRIDMLATLLDTAFVLPGTDVRFGVESLLRLLPGAGDVLASALSCYLIYEAYRLDVPRLLLARMLGNVLLEGAVGAVPVAGDAFDVYFRANRRNVALLRRYFARVGYA